MVSISSAIDLYFSFSWTSSSAWKRTQRKHGPISLATFNRYSKTMPIWGLFLFRSKNSEGFKTHLIDYANVATKWKKHVFFNLSNMLYFMMYMQRERERVADDWGFVNTMSEQGSMNEWIRDRGFHSKDKPWNGCVVIMISKMAKKFFFCCCWLLPSISGVWSNTGVLQVNGWHRARKKR